MTEVDAEQAPSASPFSAEGMPNGVPARWKPTRDAPVPVLRCTVIKKDGQRCKRFSIRGATVCYKHGGNLPTVQEHAQAVIEAARLRLLDNAELAVETLEDLLQPGTAEGIRLKAAESVLDRSGIRGGFEVDVQVEGTTDPASLIAERLEQLRSASQRMQEAAHAEEILDAEVVEDPDQGTLF